MEQLLNDLQAQASNYYGYLVVLLPRLLIGLMVLTGFWLLSGPLMRLAKRRLLYRMDDPLLATFLAQVFKTSCIAIGFLSFLQIIGLGNAVASLLAGAGISAFILGFAFKDIGENFLAGILMAFKRPFRIKDVVETGSVKGTVIGLSLRDTQIKTFDGKDVYVPNGQILKNPIINYTIDGFLRQEFKIGIDYSVPPGQAITVILETLAQVPGVLAGDKKPSVVVSNLGDSSLQLIAYYWLDTFSPKVPGEMVKNQAIAEVLAALEAAGYYLPGNVLELKNYKSEPLQASIRS